MSAEPELRTHDDAEALAADVAERLLIVLRDAQASGRTPHVALTGGTIARTIHETVARLAPSSEVDFADVVFWWGDERFVAADDEERNVVQARADMLDHLEGLDPDNIHPVAAPGEVPDVVSAASSYAEELSAHGAELFDVLMLGVGPDGHVASLFPGSPQLEATGATTVAVTDSPKPPPERVSLTFEALNRSREVWFLVSGAGKADAVAAALGADGTVTETPARGVLGRDATVWFLDRDAASAI